MRCSIISRAGQVIASGRLILQKDDQGELRLDLQTDGGRLIEGGLIGPEGDLETASQVLFRQFFQVWGMSGLTLSINIK
jgi:hypothetical protein